MKYINRLLILSIFIIPNLLAAQNISDDLKNIRKAYDSKENWHIKIASKAWDSNQQRIASHSYTTLIKKRGDEMSVDMEDVKVVVNKKYMLTFQKMNKVIACQKHNSAFFKEQQVMPDISALLDKEDQEIKYKGLLDGKHFYTIKNSDVTMPLIEMYFDPSTHLVHKLVYHFIEGHTDGLTKLEMALTYLDTKKSLSDAVFSEKQFVKIDTKNKVTLNNKFKDYYLILGEDLSYAEEVNY